MRAPWPAVPLIALLAACASPPDVVPFADATEALGRAVKLSGVTVIEELRASSLPGGQTQAQKLEKEWQQRVAVMDALAEYSAGLVAVVGAASDSAATIQGLADNLGSVATAAGLTLPASMLEGATDAVSMAFRHIANARASRTLEDSLSEANGALQCIADTLRADMQDMRQILEVAQHEATSAIGESDEFRGVELQLSKLDEKIAAIAGGAELANGSEAAVGQATRLQALVAAAGTSRSILARRDAASAATRTAFRRQLQLLLAAAAAVDEWAGTHERLVRAVKEQRPISVGALVETTAELRELIRKVRAP